MPPTLDYSIEWDDPGPFNSQFNAHHAFLNLAEILMYVPSRRAEDTQVQFDDVPAGWRIAAELPAGAAPNSFVAASYDKLVDAPVEAGKFEEFRFDKPARTFAWSWTATIGTAIACESIFRASPNTNCI